MRSVVLFAIALLVVGTASALVMPSASRRRLGPNGMPNAGHNNQKLDELYSWDHPKFAGVRRRIESSGLPSNCTEEWFTVETNHFEYATPLLSGAPKTFQMRYYTCMDASWKPGDSIFYYTGNEAPIEEFMSWTGIMWQNAKKVGAKLVWAEHRYFGKSRPWPNESMPSGDNLRYLSPDQALADYAAHINHLRYNGGAAKSAIIGFGGSYGGLLCAWMRGKYPYALDGCLASSAPVGMFAGVHPAFDTDHLSMIVTKDATPERGAAANCDNNIRTAFQVISDFVNNDGGLDQLSSIFKTCKPLSPATGGAVPLMGWIESGLIAEAQSSFPYPNSLMLLGSPGEMPAYPLHATCRHAGGTFPDHHSLLKGVAAGMEVYFNASNSSKCNDLDFSYPPSETAAVLVYLWEYIACTTVMLESSSNGKSDMFFPNPYSQAATIAGCREMYGSSLEPQPEWVQLQYGGRSIAEWATNIIFSNGGYDPIRAGGVVNSTMPGITSIVIPKYGHTGDLAFESPDDTPEMVAARMMEVDQIQDYIAEAQAKYNNARSRQ